MAPPEKDLKEKAEQAAQAAKQFSDIFYECFDKKRHALKNLYLDSATMVWNGQAVSGKDSIIKFLEDLPTSITILNSLDSQPVDESAFENQTTIVVTSFGKVQFTDNKAKSFYQTFLLSSKDNVWKIVSDNYRFMEVPPSSAGL
ncbi:NTF2-related export protein 2-like [Babylonia areolata]|uniref:NTF2-related export protein 2-like n=1 Tax=Babylonia areolata TaxID=304850 RepID=UPI003FCF48B1